MRVMHVNLGRGFRGGQRQTELLIRALHNLQLKQGLIAREDSPLIERLGDLADLEIIPNKHPYSRKRVSTRQYDLCHAHETSAAQWASINRFFCKTPYVVTRRVPKVPSDNWFTRAVYAKAERVVCLSSEIRDNLLMTAPSAKTQLIPSMCASLSVDETLLRELREKYRGKFVVGTAGALVKKHKGHHILLDALRELQSDTDLHCLILGDGYDREELEQQAEGLSNVEFLGFQSEVGTFFRMFDLFVFPSLEEGLGSTLLDVMQAGCPIVASDVGGIPEVVAHGQHGLLVPPGDAVALRDAIVKLRESPELAQDFAANGKEHAMEFLPERLAIRNFEVYQTVTAAGAD